jgi:O-acetyl-ADP-ribose deacetylase (regulator of RNase III)
LGWSTPRRIIAEQRPAGARAYAEGQEVAVKMAHEWREQVTLTQGDLTKARVDAIVNAANNELLLGGGVAGAIRAKGGPSIQDECDRIGPIAIGEAAITGAGRLAARHVIHAASMRLGEPTSEEHLRLATRNALRRAHEHGLSSIAFPAIGTGIAGFPMERCATVMLTEIRDHLRGATSLTSVAIVLYDRPSLAIFERTLAALPD